MTFGQRKAHKIIWILLTIIVPVFIVLAIQSIKEPLITDQDISNINPIGNNIILDSDQMLIEALKQNASENTIRIILKSPLKSPSTSVYAVSDNGQESFVGALTQKEVYVFNIPENSKNLIIKDHIKNKNLINIKL